MNRLLTKRDKHGSHRRSKSSEPGSKPRPLSGSGILSLLRIPDKKQDTGKKHEKEDPKKIQALKQRLRDNNISGLDESQIEYALQMKYSGGDADRAYEMLLLFQESVEGIVRPYDPNIHMLGAENRAGVTCYLDSLLFAMFARLGSFEPILYTHFEDEPRRRLSTLIRLWVNMLRSGKLIQTDITQHLQEALAACGWVEAAELCQQDTSEAFGFITEKLQLPLLTMEMDIFHEGKGDAADDHKFINERLLEVAIPQEPREGRVIRLEDCLEEYFNTRVDVVRRLDRRNTLQLPNPQIVIPLGLPTVDEKGTPLEHVDHSGAQNMQASEVPDAGIVQSPVSITSPTALPPNTRQRSTSIIRRVMVTEEGGESSVNGDASSISGSLRKGSLRKEVLMPAWQFFRIIPWYTAQIPTNDAQVAAHFSSTRPVLGICLKRYAMTAEGHPIRQNTTIDIPLQIALPHFIQDDNVSDDGPLFGNFNLVLQSAVCHRGTSVHAGHYISLIRGTAKVKDEDQNFHRRNSVDSELPAYSEDQWIKFDNLARERVTYVDIDKAMEVEMPYLLFYQVQPVSPDEQEVGLENRPPSYQDSGIGMVIQEATPITTTVPAPFPQSNTNSGYFEGQAANSEEPSRARISFSDDTDRSRKSITLPDDSRRGSLACTDASTASLHSVPVTPNDEAPSSRLSRAASRFGRRSGNGEKSKSRPNSHVDENRISATFSRLGLIGKGGSKESINRSHEPSLSDVVVSVMSIDGADDDKIQGVDQAHTEIDSAAISQPRVEPAVHQNQDSKHNKKGKDKLEAKLSDRGSSHHTHHEHGHSNQNKNTTAEHGQDRECVLM